MKIPKHFRVANVFGQITKIFKLPLEGDVVGLYSEEKNNIVLDTSLKGVELEKTLIHELMHATLARIYVHQQLSNEMNEIICEATSKVISENFHLKWKGERK